MGASLQLSERLTGQGLVSPYIEHIGGHEPRIPDLSSLTSPDPLHASLLIAQSCLLLVSGNDRPADTILRNVRDGLLHTADEERLDFDETNSQNRHLFHLAVMLLERDNEIEAGRDFQVSTHKQAVYELDQITPVTKNGRRKHDNRLGGGRRGRRTELLRTGLLARETIGMLAIQSLWHHNQSGQQASNYDMIFVSASPSGKPILTSEQLKTKCLDYCEDRKGKVKSEPVRAKYGKEIVVLSGCCDVHRGQPGPLTEHLGDEIQGKASSEIIKILDTRTVHLRKALTNPEPWRRGTAPG
jgi:hypothetical protein